jgi:hypothetical protein
MTVDTPTDEEWEPVAPAGYRDHYQVSDAGRVRRVSPGASTRPGRIRKPTLASNGHPVLKLSAGGLARSFALSSLVAAAFLPPKPPGAMVLKHRDGDRTNCAASNLVWEPRSDLAARGGWTPKLSAEQRAEVLALRGVRSAESLARRFGVSPTTIRAAWRRSGAIRAGVQQ